MPAASQLVEVAQLLSAFHFLSPKSVMQSHSVLGILAVAATLPDKCLDHSALATALLSYDHNVALVLLRV